MVGVWDVDRLGDEVPGLILDEWKDYWTLQVEPMTGTADKDATTQQSETDMMHTLMSAGKAAERSGI